MSRRTGPTPVARVTYDSRRATCPGVRWWWCASGMPCGSRLHVPRFTAEERLGKRASLRHLHERTADEVLVEGHRQRERADTQLLVAAIRQLESHAYPARLTALGLERARDT